MHDPAEPDGTTPGAGLPRRLGLATAAAMVVAEVIGVGIFLTPAGMARSLGSPAGLIGVWLVMGLSAIGGALTFGGLAARYPEAGGIYVYLREAFGPRVGFLYGWMSMLVTDPGLTAFLAVGLSTYAGHLVSLSNVGLRAVAIGSIAAMAAVNMIGRSIAPGALRLLAGLKIGLLVFLATWGLASGRGDWSHLQPFWSARPGSPPMIQAMAGGLIGAFVALAGWWDASRIAGEVRDPGRTMPRALGLGIAIVTVLYVGVSLAFLYLVGVDGSSSSAVNDEAFAAMAGRALFGRSGEVALAVAVVVSVAGSLAAVLMAMPRAYYAMARDGLFFPSFARIDPARGTPARAVALQAAIASVLVVAIDPRLILGYFMVPTLAFLAMAVAGAFRLRKTAGVVIPGFPVAPLAFLVPVLIVTAMAAAADLKNTAIGLAVVAVGLPASFLVVPAGRGAGAPDDSP